MVVLVALLQLGDSEAAAVQVEQLTQAVRARPVVWPVAVAAAALLKVV
jgi:hypothetical protein